MQLSPNFSLAEMVISETAKRKGIRNIPNQEQVNALKLLSTNVLQKVRDNFGLSIHLSSAFRCKELNKSIGGVPTSQHCKGEAADIDMDNTTITNRQVFDFIRQKLQFDQLIFEGGTVKNPAWVHVSWNANGRQRNQVLIAKLIDGKMVYQNY